LAGAKRDANSGRNNEGGRRLVNEVWPRPPSTTGPPSCFRPVWLFCCALAALPSGCAFFQHDDVPAAQLRSRILPPPNLQTPPEMLPSPSPVIPEQQKCPLPPPREPPTPSVEQVSFRLPSPAADEAEPGGEVIWRSVRSNEAPPPAPSSALSLEAAIDLSFGNSPTLDVMRERIAQAQGGRKVAFAEFLPELRSSYRPITGESNVPGYVLPTAPNAIGNLAYGTAADRIDMLELSVQSLVFDFGRTPGRYGQAVSQVEIARLQYERARQTVSFNVTAAYLQAL
jgi:hypothetical protein